MKIKQYTELLKQTSLRSKHFTWDLGAKRWDFWCFACTENGERAKNETRGWGRGRKETLADKPLDFENLRSPVNRARDWLG